MMDRRVRRRILAYLVVGAGLIVAALVWRISRETAAQVFARMQALCDQQNINVGNIGDIAAERSDEFRRLCEKLVGLERWDVEFPSPAEMTVKRLPTKESGGAMEVDFRAPGLKPVPGEGALLVMPGGKIVDRGAWRKKFGFGQGAFDPLAFMGGLNDSGSSAESQPAGQVRRPTTAQSPLP